jgi:hypothetical protein
MPKASLITAETNAEHAQAVAEQLGHQHCPELEGFLLTAQELADIINANQAHIAKPLSTLAISVNCADGVVPIEVYGTKGNIETLAALHEVTSNDMALLTWIQRQYRLRIERWQKPGNIVEVSVYTNDDDTPVAVANTAGAALRLAAASDQADGASHAN